MVTRVIDGISLCNNNGGETGTTIEHIASNLSYILGDGDRGNTAATTESTTSYARHAVRDSH